MQELKHFTLESLLDYINYYFESEKANSKSEDKSNSYQGDKGLLSFVEG